MFVRTNASRQNYRLGRCISRLSHLAESQARCHPGSLPSSLNASSTSSPTSTSQSFPLLATTRQFSTDLQTRPWRRPTLSHTNVTSHPDRTFATAVSDLPITSGHSEFKLYDIRAIDPLVTPDLLTTIEQPKRDPPKSRRTAFAVSGEIDVAMPVFEACVRVGNLERAAVVLKRLEAMTGIEPKELMYMNNLYLEAWVKQLKGNPGVGKAEDLHAWYEFHVRSAGLPQTPETIAYMLKASLLTTANDGTRLTRLMKRYMDMVPPDQGLDVLYCTDILTDPDIAAITKLYPEFNVPVFDGDEGEESAVYDSVDAETTNASNLQNFIADDGSSVPQVLETPQKGSGLQTIQSTLDIFKTMRDGYDISKLPPSQRREFQSRLERDCIDAAMERWREMDESLRKMGMNTGMHSAGMSSRLWVWHQDLEAWFKTEFQLIKKAEAAAKKSPEDAERCTYGPIIMQSTPARLAAITTLAVLNSIAFQGADKGVALSVIINAISRVAEEDIQARKFEENRKAEMRKAKAEWLREKQRQIPDQVGSGSQEQGQSAENEIPRLATDENDKQARLRTWPLTLRTKIAAVLLSGLTETAKVRVVREHAETKEKVVSMQPAFTHCHQYRRGRKVGVLMAHPVLSESMRKEPKADFLARHLPMVVAPEPWSKFNEGAYVESPVPLVRIKSGEQDQKLYTEAALARGDMEQVVKGLDVLGKTAWRINRSVFDVFLEAWNTGEAIAKVPPLNPDIPVPPEPDAAEGPLARRIWTKALKQAHNLKMGYHSVRCYMNFQLEIARAFRDQEFFFPHNVDFRGRAYPIPTYLNHMGADHVRGLLRFSKGRELGERGLMWLKVHLANVYGFDKASLKDREAFATDNLHNIIDSAQNPLKGDRWWLKAEDPWQCLAACFELKAAMDLPDPTKFVSSLPVHQDGTCNGLQHYAALGGDTWGAQQVNLLPADKPADVYSAVADLVKQSIEEDAKLGNPIAKVMTDKIKRKIVKQTVMTNVYGVTFSGAKKQVLKQIVAHYPNLEQEAGVQPGLVASYIATRIFKALATMFKGAHDIQYWLGEIGGRVCRALTAEQLDQVVATDVEPATGSHKAKKIVSKDDLLELCRSTIIWTTPLRMPVVQPYRKNQSKIVHTCMQSFILQNPNRFDPVNRRKQLQAFPPNFIHSLDASHMLLSALECDEKGLSFAAVHDSFWTHAADVDVMNGVLRDAFIRIHSEDVIKRLAAEFEARYKGGLYMAQIDRRSDAAKAILQWRSARKRTLNGRDEIVMEKQRIDLLASKDPLEQQKGREMVTPASLYEKLAPKSEAHIIPEDLSGTALGSMDGGASSVGEEDDVEDAVAAEDAQDGDTAVDSSAGRSEEDGDMNLAEDEASEGIDEATAAQQNDLDIISTYTKKTQFETMLDPPKRKSANKPYAAPVSLWVPLSFPEVPKKGDFDVKKLRESDYFFS
ncbi:DNA-directed RNA polymerase [Gnomoniopsis sp. IMI 355080]|nr:DNA-directed RNA polymerase [Gnomoniopsis sp. IMI 355080]